MPQKITAAQIEKMSDASLKKLPSSQINTMDEKAMSLFLQKLFTPDQFDKKIKNGIMASIGIMANLENSFQSLYSKKKQESILNIITDDASNAKQVHAIMTDVLKRSFKEGCKREFSPNNFCNRLAKDMMTGVKASNAYKHITKDLKQNPKMSGDDYLNTDYTSEMTKSASFDLMASYPSLSYLKTLVK